MIVSHSFVVGSQFRDALGSLRSQVNKRTLSPITLERRVGKGPWLPIMTGSQSAVLRMVKDYDGSPLPGKFRLTYEEEG